MRVLVIAEADWRAQSISDGISWRGFRCDLAFTLAAAEADLGLILYDAVILQLPLPDGEGLEWLGRRRLEPAFPPVLVLTAYDAICERIASLDAGADDCLVNPADSGEIAARLRALLRRPGPRIPPLLKVGNLEFDVAARRLQHCGQDVPLTHKEAELLELLMRRAGTVVRKSVITDALHGFVDDVTPNAVEALVSRLRHKLGASNGAANGAPVLDTVRGMGYMLREAPSVQRPPVPRSKRRRPCRGSSTFPRPLPATADPRLDQSPERLASAEALGRSAEARKFASNDLDQGHFVRLRYRGRRKYHNLR